MKRLLTASFIYHQPNKGSGRPFLKCFSQYQPFQEVQHDVGHGDDEERNRDAIPSILSDALAVSFDNNIGHDYIQNSDDRYEYYHRTEDKIPFDLEYFNKITKGGLPNKTLNIALAGTGVGKSLFMCHMASACLTSGSNNLAPQIQVCMRHTFFPLAPADFVKVY